MARTVVKRVFVLDGGTLNVESSALVFGRDFGRRVDIPVPMFLLDTDLGWVLVDTGNDPGVIDDPEATWGVELAAAVVPTMREENHPYAQLAALGLSPDDVELVVYTHLHHDHAGGARLFAHARQAVQRSEHRWAHAPDGFQQAIYLASDLEHPEIDWQLLDGDTLLMPGLHLVRTPGHTPGHQSLVLWDVPELGTVVLAGDAVYMRDNVRLGLPPGLATSAEDAMVSMHRLVALAEAHDALLVPGHDPEAWAELPKCPEPLAAPLALTT
jgi:glyoxylase-like metal-dependent hydrolase (beta-lactamase superfamily II)